MSLKYFLPIFMLCVVLGCTNDSDEMTPDSIDCTDLSTSYNSDIQPIISSSCAYTGCHVSGFGSGDFTSYSGLKAKVDNGSIRSRAIDRKDMPPSNSSGPTSLTASQIDLLTCWIESGAPEN